MVRLQTLDLRIGVRVPASQPLLAGLLCALCLPLGAQNAAEMFSKAPPDVDQTLRARVTQFYGMAMEGKFRASEALVCDASRDRYYDSAKTKWKDAAIARINYGPKFDSARITMDLLGEISTGLGMTTSRIPMTDEWRLEGGQWCLFIPEIPKSGIDTPFGKMHVQREASDAMQKAAASGGQMAALVAADPKAVARKTIAETRQNIKLSKRELTLRVSGASTDEIEIRNENPGPVRLVLFATQRAGLRLALSSTTLESNAKATLRAEYNPPAGVSGGEEMLQLQIEPLDFQIPVLLKIAAR